MAILDAKGTDYTGGQASIDGNSNFKEVARRLEGAPMTPLTVLFIYFEKQLLAVESCIKTGRVESEGLEARLNDLANYANLARGLWKEMSEEDSGTP
jgi:hypothetical protein